MSTRIGEVIEASTGELVAECYELHVPPPLGALVKAGDGDVDVYCVVCNASTESVDPGRRPLARGRDAPDEESIYREHPQLARLLRTTFQAVAVGHGQDGVIHHYLPPRPPRVHSFVHLCEPEEVRLFTQSLDFISMLLSAQGGQADEVVSACLRRASHTHEDGRGFLVRAGKDLAVQLGGELNRLNAVLRRIRP